VITAQILFKSGRLSFRTAWKEGHRHESPNAGLPEAAFAGALSVRLNGPNFYNGVLIDKPYIGVQFGQVVVDDIRRACDLLILASLLWFGCVVSISAAKPLLF
jgi:adenosylcobinamide-phosphate synthase